MKQLWLGIGLLAAILLSGLFLGRHLEETHHPQASDLEKAAGCARDDNWALAEALALRSRKNWENSRNLTAALVHHDSVKEVDARFAELSVCAEAENALEFSLRCAELARLLRSLPQSHGLSWWNLL